MMNSHFTIVCLVTWPTRASKAGGDLALIQTSLLSSLPTSQHTNNLICTTEAVRSLLKQGHLQPHCHSDAIQATERTTVKWSIVKRYSYNSHM